MLAGWATAARSTSRSEPRELRAQGWTYAEICAELGVARSSVSLWVRDVAVDPELLEGGDARGTSPATCR